MKGLDSDNGSELKNNQLLQWCYKNQVEFTRSRPYKKNDNCFVEQKMTASFVDLSATKDLKVRKQGW